MQVLYYAEYLHLFERARSQYIRDMGMSYAEVEERGIFLPVREANSRYRCPIRYDDEIVVRTGICEWKRVSMRFQYEVWSADRKTLHATGFTEHACVNSEGRPVRVPEWLKGMFVGETG